MNSLGSFLDRFKKISLKDEDEKKALIQIIKNKINVSIESQEIKIQNGTAYLYCETVYKSEIYLHKGELLNELHGRGVRIRDIR